MRASPAPAGVLAAAFALAGVALPGASIASADPLVHTYSIVARDPATGEMGVAVQSHWFSVGSIVTWAEAGVGAIATQSLVDPSYGPKGLELMRQGVPAPKALAQLVAADTGRNGRQVAMVDATGAVDAYTGPGAIAAAGHHVGAQYSVQANMMGKPSVWPAMAKAFEAATGPLADRLIAALEAAEREGGDVRGRQSAALLIVKAKGSGKPWVGGDRVFDLRVDDHPQPVAELKRLVRLQKAYTHANRGDELMTEKKVEEALQEYAASAQLAPEIVELPFWQAVTLASIGKEAEAAPIFKAVFAKEPIWAELLGRLPAAGLFPDDKALIARIKQLKP
ncbi:MAG TPA: DUF1028 domain-containing protein [Vicinamibacterales bacterium]|nr:DUF1028 domain-containing protein [Vicinamibacterales bacterium]